MAFWNRGKKESEDNEDDSYYIDGKENERSQLTSFVFGVAALLITILIATAIVFGARAIYRAINGNKSSDTTNVSHNNGQDTPSGEASNKKTNKQANGSGSTGGSHQSTTTTPSTGDNLPSTGDNVPLPKTGDPGM
jgi:hypothetical protein